LRLAVEDLSRDLERQLYDFTLNPPKIVLAFAPESLERGADSTTTLDQRQLELCRRPSAASFFALQSASLDCLGQFPFEIRKLFFKLGDLSRGRRLLIRMLAFLRWEQENGGGGALPLFRRQRPA
jgi:hypothetical protein